MPTNLTDKSIDDYGVQWTKHTANEGYYASLEMFSDIVGDFVSIEDLVGKKVADIGSGTGRIVNMLLRSGASKVVAMEPSAAIDVLKKNILDPDRVQALQLRGDQLPATGDLDYVFSFGVLDRIPEPQPVAQAAHAALRQGGKVVFWFSGKEGNEAYLAMLRPLRLLTQWMPHPLMTAVSWALTLPLKLYMLLCRFLPLPMRSYMVDHLSKITWAQQMLTIYDQLNPSYVKFFTREEALDLLRNSGFQKIEIFARHGYSWTVTGEKA
jgi:SAM-dependent methyltransferase